MLHIPEKHRKTLEKEHYLRIFVGIFFLQKKFQSAKIIDVA